MIHGMSKIIRQISAEKNNFDPIWIIPGAWFWRGFGVVILNFAVEIPNFAVENPNFAVVSKPPVFG